MKCDRLPKSAAHQYTVRTRDDNEPGRWRYVNSGTPLFLVHAALACPGETLVLPPGEHPIERAINCHRAKDES